MKRQGMLIIFIICLLGLSVYGSLWAGENEEEVIFEKAVVLEKRCDLKGAMLEYEKVLEEYADTEFGGIALYKIAMLHNMRREEEKAKEKYRGFISSYPQHKNVADAYIKLSYIYADQKHYEEANNVLREALRKYPNNKRAKKMQYEIFLNLYTGWSSGRPERLKDPIAWDNKQTEAIEEARTYLRDYPEDKYVELVQIMISSVYKRKGDYTQAIKELDKYLQSNPKDKKLVKVALSEKSVIQSYIRREKLKKDKE